MPPLRFVFPPCLGNGSPCQSPEGADGVPVAIPASGGWLGSMGGRLLGPSFASPGGVAVMATFALVVLCLLLFGGFSAVGRFFGFLLGLAGLIVLAVTLAALVA